MKILARTIPPLVGTIFLMLTTTGYAGSPVWTLDPITNTTVEVPVNSTALIQYTVTNQSSKSHTLTMTPITGISQLTIGTGICSNPFTLAAEESCTLSLKATGSELTTAVTGGPRVCEQGSILQCYQPSPQNVLHVTTTDAELPTLESITPNYGSTEGGTQVILTGAYFSGATLVMFGETPATNVTVVNDAHITATAPAHAIELVNITVTTPAGSSSADLSYAYGIGEDYEGGVVACLSNSVSSDSGEHLNLIAKTLDQDPSVWDFYDTLTGATNPVDGALNTDTIIGMLGTGFDYAAKACRDYTIDSNSVSPCAGGGGTTCYDDWFLPAIEQLQCLYSNRGSIAGFDTNKYWSSSETSANLAEAMIFLNNSPLFAVESAVSLTKNSVIGIRCVREFTPDPEPPTLELITPNAGPTEGGTSVTLTGENFLGATSVTFDGTPADFTVHNGGTQITAIAPAHVIGLATVTVTTPAGSVNSADAPVPTVTYTYGIGQVYQGGVVACAFNNISSELQHFDLIAATTDQSSVQWSGYGTVTGAQDLLDGDSNTNTITEELENIQISAYAAQVCHDYMIDSNGRTPCVEEAGTTCYDDWFLPAIGQLQCLSYYQDSIGEFTSGVYWSSTENPVSNNPATLAYALSFDGGIYLLEKNKPAAVRCVREFTPPPS